MSGSADSDNSTRPFAIPAPTPKSWKCDNCVTYDVTFDIGHVTCVTLCHVTVPLFNKISATAFFIYASIEIRTISSINYIWSKSNKKNQDEVSQSQILQKMRSTLTTISIVRPILLNAREIYWYQKSLLTVVQTQATMTGRHFLMIKLLMLKLLSDNFNDSCSCFKSSH